MIRLLGSLLIAVVIGGFEESRIGFPKFDSLENPPGIQFLRGRADGLDWLIPQGQTQCVAVGTVVEPNSVYDCNRFGPEDQRASAAAENSLILALPAGAMQVL